MATIGIRRTGNSGTDKLLQRSSDDCYKVMACRHHGITIAYFEAGAYLMLMGASKTPYTVIAAHPDDEILWFGALLSEADKVIVCYGNDPKNPEIGDRRRVVMKTFPLNNVEFLDLEEGGFFNKSDWSNPTLTDIGTLLTSIEDRRKYEENFRLLREKLQPFLSNQRYVVTHNPWGEYGHEDHAQVFRAVHSIVSAVPGTTLYVPSYVSQRSSRLMRLCQQKFQFGEAFAVETPMELCDKIKALYQENGCWTWKPDWIADKEQSFVSARAKS